MCGVWFEGNLDNYPAHIAQWHSLSPRPWVLDPDVCEDYVGYFDTPIRVWAPSYEDFEDEVVFVR